MEIDKVCPRCHKIFASASYVKKHLKNRYPCKEYDPNEEKSELTKEEIKKLIEENRRLMKMVDTQMELMNENNTLKEKVKYQEKHIKVINGVNRMREGSLIECEENFSIVSFYECKKCGKIIDTLVLASRHLLLCPKNIV